jgi:hypothetical protein
MAIARVPVFRSQKVVQVEPGATAGAVVGVNLLNPDGSLYVPPDSTPAETSSGIALDDVQANAAAPLTVNGSPAQGAFEYGWDGTTSDVPEPATGAVNLYFTNARAYAALKVQLVQGANIKVKPDDGTATITIADDSTVPYHLADGDMFLVPDGKQALWAIPIDLDGNASLDISGALVEVS